MLSNLHTTYSSVCIFFVTNCISTHPTILTDCLHRVVPSINKRKHLYALTQTNLEHTTFHKFEDLFKTEITDMNLCTEATHSIRTWTKQPIYQRSTRFPIHLEKQLDDTFQTLLKHNIIKESKSPYCSRIVPVLKPDGTLRPCIDFRPLNSITIKDRYPIPRIDEILDALSKAKIFSTLDATSEYYQLAMNPEDAEKTAFAYKNGFFEFTRMPFGLCNAPATFQRAIDNILRKERFKIVIPYLDDIIVYSNNEKEHQEHLKVILGKLKASGLSLNKKKCRLFRTQIRILGQIVSEGKVATDPERISAIRTFPRPQTV